MSIFKYFFYKKKSKYYILKATILSLLLLLIIKIFYLAFFTYLDFEKQKNQNLIKKDLIILTNKINSEKENNTDNKDNNKEYRDIENSKISINKGLYVEVENSCGVHFGGSCVRARSCPSLSCPVIISLRNNMVLKTTGETFLADNITWYKIVFDEWRRYDDRLPAELYVSQEYLNLIESQKESYSTTTNKPEKNTTNKKIIINRTEQKLYAYEGENLFMETYISTGLEDLPTPKGTFQIFEKTPSRYMQGPLPGISDDVYDLPGVPWTMYFTKEGAAIHGAYWHDKFGEKWSHGCVNLLPSEAEILYKWAELGTLVIVKD